MSTFNVGDEVKVQMPAGLLVGRVETVLKNYGFNRETKYSIHGKGFETIASARVIRALPATRTE